ncbi:MAG: hypothetical protein JXQ76_10150 [Campylobacterales bacterium]|nr:hypothetical protein [Campylobacterales bacterium]
MFKNINWLGIASLLFTLLALLASATFFLLFFALFFAFVALVLAYYSKKSWMRTATNYISGFIFVFWTLFVLLGAFVRVTS